jgi:hypothetical protein
LDPTTMRSASSSWATRVIASSASWINHTARRPVGRVAHEHERGADGVGFDDRHQKPSKHLSPVMPVSVRRSRRSVLLRRSIQPPWPTISNEGESYL